MFTILVANPKGGAGKSTLTTNISGMLASLKQRVVIMDLDKQQSATNWLARRPAALPKIMSWTEHTDKSELRAFAPRWMVIDAHTRLRRADRAYLLSRADVVLVPVNASVFDIEATAAFLAKLQQDENVHSGRVAIGLVGSRTDRRTRMAKELANFFQQRDFEVVAYVPNHALYSQCASEGVSIFDLPRTRTEQQLEAWQPLVVWLKAQVARTRRTRTQTRTLQMPEHGIVPAR
jgi:chromosome partitioning protein